MDLKCILQDVTNFHKAIGASVADEPVLLPHDKSTCQEVTEALHSVCEICRAGLCSGNDLFARLAMAVEELAEWVEAHEKGDLVAAADAWGDRLYVLLGDAVAAGLPAADIFAEVHRSNMTKAARRANDTGKAQKGDGFAKPQLADLLRRASHHSPE